MIESCGCFSSKRGDYGDTLAFIDMTKEDAISKAADWWTDMVFSGHWENGDAFTESIHALTRKKVGEPQPTEASALRAAFLDLLQTNHSVYNDYQNYKIDEFFKKHNLKYESFIHCPQKAGTRIFEENGEWVVEAKSGYGKDFVRLWNFFWILDEEHSI